MEAYRNYQIINLKENSSFLILINSWERPEFYLEEIEKELSSCENNSDIYFDFLIKNGPRDRFYSANFDNGRFDLYSFKKINTLSTKILGLADNYFKSNFDLIQNSCLTRAQKFVLKRQFQSLA